MTAYDLATGRVTLMITLPENFVLSRHLLGDTTWAPSYTYRIDRVDNDHGTGFTLFLATLTDRGRKSPTFVYTGIVHPLKGCVRLTAKSAFPATATRVRVASRVLEAICAGRTDAIIAAGWSVELKVEAEVANRF